MRLKTGIFGGTFDPIHNGHVSLAKILLKQLNLNEIWFIVSPQNPFKQNLNLLDDDKRLELVRLALKNEPNLIPSDYEFHLPKPSYMWNTLQHLSEDYPDREFTLLIGADNWQRFGDWYHHDDILKNYRIGVYPRKNYIINELEIPRNVTVVKTALIDISSTEIRNYIREGKNFQNWVPLDVANVIKREKIYLKR